MFAALAVIIFVTGMSVLQSCSQNDMELKKDMRLATLERKYKVTISPEKQVPFTQMELAEIEQEIIKFTNYITVKKTVVKLSKVSKDTRFKSRVIERASLTSWVTNLI